MSARARTRAPRSHSTLARVDQHAGVQDARRVERRLGGGECGGEARRTLPVVPGPVVAADGVVVRDRAAEPQDGVGGGLLDGRPLLELGAAPPRRDHRVVGRRAVGVDVCEAARQLAAAAHQAERLLGRRGHALVKGREAIPGDGGLEGLADHAHGDQRVAMGMISETFETAVTWDRFPAFHEGVTAATEEALRLVCGGGQLTCRFTHVYPDGPAPYYTVIAPGRRGAELEQWAAIKQAASDAILRLGGTITHHHAVGRHHRPWYDRERPAGFAAALVAAKAALDPAGVLNPGVLIDPR